MNLSDLANPKEAMGPVMEAVAENDLDKLIKFAKEVNKLLDSPLGKVIMKKYGVAQEPAQNAFGPDYKGEAITVTDVVEVPVGVQPATDLHEEVFKILNNVSAEKLQEGIEALQESGMLDKMLGGMTDGFQK